MATNFLLLFFSRALKTSLESKLYINFAFYMYFSSLRDLPECALSYFCNFLIFATFIAVGKIVILDVLLFLHQGHGARRATGRNTRRS